MTTQSLTLETEPRDATGRKVRALRRQGATPLHLYGRGLASLTLQASSIAIQRLVARAGRNIPISVTVKGNPEPHVAFIREIQRDPITEDILHVDFFQVPLAEKMRAAVPVYFKGEAPAVRRLSGNLVQAIHAIEVECLPLDLPQYVEVDISGLDDFEKSILVSSINLGDSVTILTRPEELIARVNAPRVVEEEVAAPTAEAAAATAEGEEAPAEGGEEEKES